MLKKKWINSGNCQPRESLTLSYSPERGCEDQRIIWQGQEQNPAAVGKATIPGPGVNAGRKSDGAVGRILRRRALDFRMCDG
jgi:hypothetical protein